MRKLIKLSIYSVALLFILLSAIISFLVTTNTGLYASLRIANWVVPGKISVQEASGSLLSKWHLQHLNYQSQDLNLKLDSLETHWKLFDLVRGQLTIHQLNAGHLVINTEKTKDTDKQQAAATNTKSLQLPINVVIRQLTLNKISIDQQVFSDIDLSANLNQSSWTISQLSLKNEQIHLEISGDIVPSHPFSTDLKLSSKALSSDGLSGEFTLKGNWQDYAWQGYITKPFSLLTTGHIKEGQEINGQAKWQAFTWPGKHKRLIRIAPGELMVNGNADKLVFNLNTALMKPLQTVISASGFHTPHRNEAIIQLRQKKGTFNAKISQDIGQIDRKTIVKVDGNRLNLTPYGIPIKHLDLQGQAMGKNLLDIVVNLSAKGFYYQNPLSLKLQKTAQSISGEVQLANNHIRVTGNNPFPLHIQGTIPSPHLLSSKLEGLKTQINLNGQFNSSSDGHADLTIQAGEYIPPDDQSLPPLTFIGGNYRLSLSSQGLQVSGKLAIDKKKTLLTKVRLPNWSMLGNTNQAQTISGQLSLTLNSLDFLSQINPNVQEAKGNINAQLNLSGRLASPRLNGKIVLRQGSFKTPYSDKPYQPVTAQLITTNHRWRLRGNLNHENSHLTMTGSGQLTPHLNGKITIHGNQFLAMNNKEYQVYVSPNITVQLSPNQTLISGDMTIPKARISPQTFSSTVTLSDDVVFAHQQQDDGQSAPYLLNIAVKMGDDVRLYIEGLSAKIIGAIRLQKQSGGTLTSSGQLSVSDGKYAAYGQQLDISQGELLFTGGSITNPGINIRATRTFNTSGQAFSGSNRLFDFGASNIQSMSFSNVTTVGIQVTGRINNPKVSLFSEPSNLQQSDILSMLLLGRPASQASDSGGQLLLSAITSMGLDRGTEGGQLLTQLKDKLGLEFSVDDNTTYNPDQDQVSSSHSVGVKKKFSDRLSIGYNMGIYDSNTMVLTLTYLLNKYLSIQVNAGDTASGIDLTYTRSKN